MSSNRKDMIRINQMVQIIKQTGGIHKWDLKDEVKISITEYNKLQGYMKHKMAGIVRYDKESQCWLPVYAEKSAKLEKEITLDDEENV